MDKSRKHLFETFANTPPEVHASIAGLTPGTLLALVWNTPYKGPMLAMVMGLLATGFGIKGLDRITNKKIAGQLRSEVQYLLGGLLAGLALGFAVSLYVL